MTTVLAEIATADLHVVLRSAPAVTLHGSDAWRSDGNTPVLVDADGLTVFVSHYEPRGHTFRRRGGHRFDFDGPSIPIRVINDPNSVGGRWIEAVHREGGGRLRAWCHAEERAPCPGRLFVPHIEEMESDDDGFTWTHRGVVLRAPADQVDCRHRNGFVAGGYGDCCVAADRDGRFLYMPFTSYVADEGAQGVAMARMPVTRPAVATVGMEIWCAGGWQSAAGRLPKPLWPTTRGWRHRDPDAFWGPALHYNRILDAYVLLLNHTAGGRSDFRQEGIYVSINATPDEPTHWTTPVRIVRGGAWYPEIVGLDPGCGDTQVTGSARFFMAGFSAWEIDILPGSALHFDRPLCPTKEDFRRLFGAARCPW